MNTQSNVKRASGSRKSIFGGFPVQWIAVLVLLLTLVTPALAQRRGSFGGGGGFRSSGSFGRSYGGGSFGRSPGGSSFSRPPSGGSFGRSNSGSSFGRGGTATAPPQSGFRSSGSGSFGRSGSFGSSGRINSTSINGYRATPPPVYSGIPYSSHTTVYYGGSPYSGFAGGFLGGYSLGMLSSPWTHWMPFHPGFYVDPPMYYNGAYYAGGFSFTRFLLGIVIIGVVIWFLSRLFRGGRGGGGRIRYTTYK